MREEWFNRSSLARVAIAALMICAAWIYSRFPSAPTATLPDTTRLSLRDAKVGIHNEFKHGKPIEKLLGRLISTNGWKIGHYTLHRPGKQTFGWADASFDPSWLTLEFQLTGPGNLVQQSELLDRAPSPFYRNFRFRHWGEDGYAFTEEAYPPLVERFSDGYFGYLTTATFARTSRTLHLQLEQRKTETAPWNIVAAFDFPNPARVTAKNWQVQNYPVKIEHGPFTAVLEEVQVQQPRDHSAPYYSDIWQHAVIFPFQFYLNGVLTTNWIVKEMNVMDATGNTTLFKFASVTNGWSLLRGWRSPLPTVPWQCKGHFTLPPEPFMLEIPSLLFPFAVPIATNLAGLPATITFEEYDTLAVTIPAGVVDRRIVFEAFDQEGRSISDNPSPSAPWNQNEFRRRLKMNDVNAIKLEIALLPIIPDIPFDFTIQPVLVPEIRTP